MRSMHLKQYLAENNVAIPTFAKKIGVSVQAVHRYCSGERTPKSDVMSKIRDETGGKVQPNDFYAEAA